MNRPRAKVEEDELESRNGESIALGPSLETVSNVCTDLPERGPRAGYLLCGADLMSTGTNYELARDARIWSTYVREAERWDEDMVRGSSTVTRGEEVATAALFSAISTAWVIERLYSRNFSNFKPSSPPPTHTQIPHRVCKESTTGPYRNALREVASLLRVQVLNATSPTEAGFTPSLAAVWVSALWFLSLSLSVSVPLVAMLAKTVVLFVRIWPDRSAARSGPLEGSVDSMDWNVGRCLKY
ncbi:hypothetical protein RHS01_07107 [Rhizoctonia solani]|uniref:DUF6535 domain-containing protein n=1 Tax=Rhizoctonia solani TaxID=456999 RepID=A0A8H7M5P1_9AGAM|nr:hypothetical protein RHS01_07107 [Rhizoctonia solani]